jgi:hypothetical protein
MKTNNQYWGLPITDLKALLEERIMLLKYATSFKLWEQANEHEKEMSLILDAIAAHERGGNE